MIQSWEDQGDEHTMLRAGTPAALQGNHVSSHTPPSKMRQGFVLATDHVFSVAPCLPPIHIYRDSDGQIETWVLPLAPGASLDSRFRFEVLGSPQTLDSRF